MSVPKRGLYGVAIFGLLALMHCLPTRPNYVCFPCPCPSDYECKEQRCHPRGQVVSCPDPLAGRDRGGREPTGEVSRPDARGGPEPPAGEQRPSDAQSCQGSLCKGWVKVILGAGSSNARDLVVDEKHDIYLAATFTGQVILPNSSIRTSLGSTDHDIFVQKYSAAGEAMWSNVGQGAGVDELGGLILQASGRLILGGHFQQALTFSLVNGAVSSFRSVGSKSKTHGFLLRLDKDSGRANWGKVLHSSKDFRILGLYRGTAPTVLATGSFTGSFKSNQGEIASNAKSNAYFLSYDTQKYSVVRFVRIPGNDWSAGYFVRRTGSGGVLVGGQYEGTLKPGGDEGLSNALQNGKTCFLAHWSPTDDSSSWVVGVTYPASFHMSNTSWLGGLALRPATGELFAFGNYRGATGTMLTWSSKNRRSVSLSGTHDADAMLLRFDDQGRSPAKLGEGFRLFRANSKTSPEIGNDVAYDPSRDWVCATGSFIGEIALTRTHSAGVARRGVFVVCVDARDIHSLTFSAHASSTGKISASKIVVDGLGNIIVSGSFEGKPSFYPEAGSPLQPTNGNPGPSAFVWKIGRPP